MTGYEVKIKYSSKELTARERLRAKDTTASLMLADMVKDGPLVIDFSYYVILSIHNERAKGDTDYEKIIIVDKAGTMYNTGSQSLLESLTTIIDEMGDEDFEIEVYERPSKNYTGKSFLTCTIV